MNEVAIPDAVSPPPERRPHPAGLRRLEDEFANAPAALVKRDAAFYQRLGDEVLFNQTMWAMAFDRCKCFASLNYNGNDQPEALMASFLKGLAAGMNPMQAWDSVRVIKGTPVIRGPKAINHIHSRCQGAHCREVTDLIGTGEDVGVEGFNIEALIERLKSRYPQYWTEDGRFLDETKISVWVMGRPGWRPKAFVFTWAQAQQAKLIERNPVYKLYPERCLKWQACSIGTQEMFGDVLGGLYLQEEIEGAYGLTSGGAGTASYTPEPGPGRKGKSKGKSKGKGKGKGKASAANAQSEPEPESAPNPAPESTPDPAPESTPDPAPESTLERANEPQPQSEPEPQAAQQPQSDTVQDEKKPHPKVATMSFLLDAAASGKADPGSDAFVEARKSAYREACQTALGKDLGNKPPTLPQLDKLIAHLKGAS